MISRILAVTTAVLALAGCQTATAPPPADPYLGLLPPGKQVVQSADGFPISGAKRKSVGLVYSESTGKQLDYIDQYFHELKSTPGLAYSKEAETLADPKYLSTTITNKMKEKFGSVVLLDDFRSSGSVDYLALIDISLEFPHNFTAAYTYRIRVDMLNNRLERLGSLTGYGYQTYYCMACSCCVAVAYNTQKTAVDQFTSAADGALR